MPEERFWNQVKEIDGCWIWQGYLNDDGYGRLRWKSRLILAHVLAYNLKVGEVPIGLELDHTCRNRACVNVKHLEPVTHKENMCRGIARNTKKAVCKRGHILSGNNLYTYPSGYRKCRTCAKQWMQEHR